MNDINRRMTRKLGKIAKKYKLTEAGMVMWVVGLMFFVIFILNSMAG